jgi:hypothetical protein
MQSYRLVPVGDKIVLMVDREPLHLVATVEAQWNDAPVANAGYYDFRNGTANEDGPLGEYAAPTGGYSNE